jgi:Fic family protein
MIFQASKIDSKEREVLGLIEQMRTTLRYRVSTPPRWFGLLRRNTFARAVRGSNSIEGYNVSREDAIAAVEGDEPVDAKGVNWSAVVGYRNAMTFVLQLAKDPNFSFNEGFIRSLHYMMLHYDLARHPGNWRPGPIYVRDENRRETVYTAPDAGMIPSLINEILQFLNESHRPEEVIIKAAMAHLNLVLVHPFSDGNGRMARCLQTLVLATDGILEPVFSSVEEYLGRNTQAYYDVLAVTAGGGWNPLRDTRQWIRFSLTAHYRQAGTMVVRMNLMQSLWEEIEKEIEKRGLPDRCVLALTDAAIGYKVRNTSYRTPAEITANLASRDLQEMVDARLLVPVGEKRGREYVASEYLKNIRASLGPIQKIADPFEIDTQEPRQVPLFA